MTLSDFLSVDTIDLDCQATSIKQAFTCVADKAIQNPRFSNKTLDKADLVTALLEREKLGSTAIGEGIALPHAKIAELDAMQMHFVRLANGIDFEALDDQPVDLICCLFVPLEACMEQKKCLAKVSRILREPSMQAQLRAAQTPGGLLSALSTSYDQPAAQAA